MVPPPGGVRGFIPDTVPPMNCCGEASRGSPAASAGRPAGERIKMVQINMSAREITVKVVYYGPALSGKTTNLQQLHSLIDPAARGKMVALDTTDDRTLYFDFLPIHFDTTS